MAVAAKFDPRAFLKEKLGAAGLKKFEEGMRIASKAKAAGKGKAAADVEGQSCIASCLSYCGASRFLNTGSYSTFSI